MRKESARLYRILRYPLRFFVKLLYNPIVEGEEYIPKEGSAILAGNHNFFYDPLLVGYATKRTVYFLAKKELHQGIFKSWFFKSVGTIPVDRKNKDAFSMESAMNVLNSKEIIGIFPEGTRNKTENITILFKFGAVSLAKKTDTIIVPFAVTRKKKGIRRRPKIKFSQPMDVTNIELENANQLLRERVEEMIKEDN